MESLDEERIFTITQEDHQEFKRLDHLLAKKCPDLSRTFIKSLFDKGLLECCDQKIELKKVPPVGSELILLIPPPIECRLEAQNIPLDILFEDEHLVIINKQAGLVIHPAPGHPDSTLVNAVLYHCQDLQGVGDQKRPGIVHRLDKGTTGVMVVAKTQKCHEGLVLLFSEHNITRRYHALVVKKELPVGGTLNHAIGRHQSNRQKMDLNRDGKKAITHYKVLKQYSHLTHVECRLETGRTHQIRVHLSRILNAPILNDSLYGNDKQHLQILSEKNAHLLQDYEHPLLHAKVLGFIHPITKEELLFEAPYPPMFQSLLNNLNDE